MSHHVNSADFEEEHALPSIGEVIAGKYRVDSILGRGGMGVVLAATHLELGQAVAIKVLTIQEQDGRRDEARERFLREGRATAALVSDNVVRIYDVGTLESGAPFMVMEFLRGRDLALTLQQNGALPIAHAADYVRQAADAIACAHAIGIVHRDLKPSNLFLTQRSDGTPLIKVLDFGISKSMRGEVAQVAGNLTAPRSILGTPFYMSPEQIRDAKHVDFRTDIWSLGLILHELLAGSPAFEGATLPSVCAAIAADPPAALRVQRREIPVELEAIVLKCLEKNPARRFQDTRELSSKLAAFCLRQPASSLLPLQSDTRSSPYATALERQGRPTIDSGAQLFGPLDSASEQSSARGPAVWSKDQRTVSVVPTAVSAANSTLLAGRLKPHRSRIWLPAISLGLLGCCIWVTWALFGSSHDAPSTAGPVTTPSASTLAATRSTTFSLQVTARPADAQVYEGGQLLGSTPLHVTIDPASLTHGARIFSVRKSGYAPYTIVQGPAERDVSVFAELSAEPKDMSSLAAVPSAARPNTLHARRLRIKPTLLPPDTRAQSDIFMQR
jgi:serine/threonine protein kinase